MRTGRWSLQEWRTLGDLGKGLDVLGLTALRAVHHLEADPLALGQGAIALLLDGRVVDEGINAVADIDESVTLGRVKPLHFALLQLITSPFFEQDSKRSMRSSVVY